MTRSLTQDRVLGLIVLAIGLVVTFYWAGADSDTGLVEKVRGRTSVGDALAPSVAGAILILAGAWLAIAGSGPRTIDSGNAIWIVTLAAAVAGSLAAMRWGGPALVEVITGAEYRPLRDTLPWKYAGFLIGGTLMITTLIFIVERYFRWSRLAIAFGVTLFLALIYDLPFDNLLLPPNGDV